MKKILTIVAVMMMFMSVVSHAGFTQEIRNKLYKEIKFHPDVKNKKKCPARKEFQKNLIDYLTKGEKHRKTDCDKKANRQEYAACLWEKTKPKGECSVGEKVIAEAVKKHHWEDYFSGVADQGWSGVMKEIGKSGDSLDIKYSGGEKKLTKGGYADYLREVNSWGINIQDTNACCYCMRTCKANNKCKKKCEEVFSSVCPVECPLPWQKRFMQQTRHFYDHIGQFGCSGMGINWDDGKVWEFNLKQKAEKCSQNATYYSQALTCIRKILRIYNNINYKYASCGEGIEKVFIKTNFIRLLPKEL